MKKSFVYDFCKSAKVILTHRLCLPRQAPALHCSLCQWAGRTGRSCPSCSPSTDLAASRGRCTEETAGHFYPLLSSPGDRQTQEHSNTPQFWGPVFQLILLLWLTSTPRRRHMGTITDWCMNPSISIKSLFMTWFWMCKSFTVLSAISNWRTLLKGLWSLCTVLKLTLRDLTLKLINWIPLKSTLS